MFKVIKMSENTKEYIETYYKIFDEMKDKMDSLETTSSIAINYINAMIPHHESAVKMSENILKYTTDIDIEKLAKDIIENNIQHISQLENLRDVCNSENSERDLSLYEKGYRECYNKMIRKMSSAPSGNNVNIDFLYEMIPHHEGAVEISKNLLKYEVCQELNDLAESTIISQQMQIDEMKTLLRKLF